MEQLDMFEEYEKKKKAERALKSTLFGYGIKYHSTDKKGNVYFEIVPPYENYEHYKLYHDTDTSTAG